LRRSWPASRWAALVLVVFLPVGVGGCGDDEAPARGGATVLMTTPPDYLDPQLAYTTRAAEADWLAYTPLLTYRHKGGSDGTELIPGLAESLPRISGDGRRYTFTLRQNLRYSNGRRVLASDFPYTIERAIRLGWGGKRFLTEHILGAADYEAARAESISGIEADDATGTISIRLRRAYGAFSNVLALPATGLVPRGTPFRDQSAAPPPGVGPYFIADVSPNRGWTMVRSPRFAAMEIPGIPTGGLDRIRVRIEPNPREAVEEVLSGQADGLDPGVPIQPSALPRIESAAEGRFELKPIPSTVYYFMNTTVPPFSSELARRAVVTALDRPAIAQLSGKVLEPACFLLPDGIVGHRGGHCPYGDADEHGDIAAAREMVDQSGTAGQPIIVWGETSAPSRVYVRYYVHVLKRLGYAATQRLIPPPAYFDTVGSAAVNPQTGVERWFNDFPHPSDFLTVIDARAISPTGSLNVGRVDDEFIQQQLEGLDLVTPAELRSSAGGWRDVDEYAAQKAYLGVFGTERVPKLLSDRIDFDSAVIHPLFLSDWSTWSLRDGG
jgi:peptide/nickel transport system substrate-binding protein